VSGQPIVTSSTPALSTSGTDTVFQSSQVFVAGADNVRVTPLTETFAVRVWRRPSPPVPLA
jgi:hypothetical protein